MKRTSRTKRAFSRSGEASSAAKGKGEGKRQQRRSGRAASSASSGDEISSNRSVSSGEEATGSTRRPPKKERRRWLDPKLLPALPRYEVVQVEGRRKYVECEVKRSAYLGQNILKSSASHSIENNSREEGSSSSHRKGKVEDAEVSSGIVRGPNQCQQVQHSGGSFDQKTSSRGDDAQVATEASAAPLSEVVGDSSTGDILKEGCLDDAELPSRSESVEAQEKTSFDEETTALLRGEDNKKKPKPFSGELGKIARDGDEHSGKDLRKMIAPDEDEQHPDKIGVPAIEDLIQGKEGAGWRVLLDIDPDTVLEKTFHYFAKLRSDHPDDDCDYLPPYEPHQLTEVYEQLAFYRIRGYQLSVDQQLAELDDENLKKHYSSSDLLEEGYFEHYEESLEWYFDPELCKHPGYDDYQRLVLYNHVGEYLDWENYHSILNTYEKDLAYVQYCEALANKTKWIKDYLAQSTHQWDRVKNVAFLQALQIATGFANVSPRLVLFAFQEYIWSILFDHSNYKDMDGVYFEIWKRVAKLKKDFREALLEIHRENMFPLRALEIEHELEDKQLRVNMKDNYDAYVAGIDEMASDDKAHQDIREAVKKMIPKRMVYLDYIQKKVDIAKDIGLIGKAPPQLRGDDNQGRHPEDNSAK